MAAFCSKCGSHVEENERFCPKCGNDVTAGAAASAPAVGGPVPVAQPVAPPPPVYAAPPPPPQSYAAPPPPPQGYPAPPPPGYGAPGPIPCDACGGGSEEEQHAVAGDRCRGRGRRMVLLPQTASAYAGATDAKPTGAAGRHASAAGNTRAAGRSGAGWTERGTGPGAAMEQPGTAGQWSVSRCRTGNG